MLCLIFLVSAKVSVNRLSVGRDTLRPGIKNRACTKSLVLASRNDQREWPLDQHAHALRKSASAQSSPSNEHTSRPRKEDTSLQHWGTEMAWRFDLHRWPWIANTHRLPPSTGELHPGHLN